MARHLKTWLPIIVGITVFAIGLFGGGALGLYERIFRFDKMLHVAGGFVVAWAALAWLQNELAAVSPFKRTVIIVSTAVAVGTFWEFAEFLANSAPQWLYYWFHGGSLADTIHDLMADTIGATLWAAWAHLRHLD